MVRFLPLWNYINDESHDCVAFYRPDAIGGPRSPEHVRQRDTMNLSRGLGHATCLGLLAPSFSTYSRGSLRSLFSHLCYPPRAARAINFSNTATVFTAGSRGKYAKLKLSRETARLERVRLETHREPCEETRFFVITFFLLYNFLLATCIRVLDKWLCTCDYY